MDRDTERSPVIFVDQPASRQMRFQITLRGRDCNVDQYRGFQDTLLLRQKASQETDASIDAIDTTMKRDEDGTRRLVVALGVTGAHAGLHALAAAISQTAEEQGYGNPVGRYSWNIGH